MEMFLFSEEKDFLEGACGILAEVSPYIKQLRLVYKPHSVQQINSACAVISLGGASPRRSMQPTRGWLLPQEEGARAETSSLPSSTDDFAPA